MIQFMSPVIVPPRTKEKPSWIERWWKRSHQTLETHVGNTRTTEMLDLIDRVRGAEAQLSRLKMEEAKCGRR